MPLANGPLLDVYSGVCAESGVHHLGVIYRVTGSPVQLARRAWLGRDELERLPLVPLARFALTLARPSPCLSGC